MNIESIIWLMYFADVAESLKKGLMVISVFALIICGFALSWIIQDIDNLEIDKKYSEFKDIENEIKEKKTLFKKVLKYSIISISITSLFALIIPSKNIIYSYAAVKIAKISYYSNKHIPNIINETLKLIDLKLQKEIKKLENSK